MGADDGQVTRNADGSGTITGGVRYTKMFHPKARANWHIAQAVLDVMILN